MRVLWFTNTISCYTPLGEARNKGYNGGGWISSAEKKIRRLDNIELAVSFMYDNQPLKVEQSGLVYYPIPHNESAIMKIKTLISGHEKFEISIWAYYLEHFKRIVDDFKPNIIHVWGSERQFGLVWKVAKCPVLLHIQGIIGPCLNAYMPSGMSKKDQFKGVWNPIKRLTNLYEDRLLHNSEYREQEIFKGLTAVMGRTEWDRYVSHCFNPKTAYFHVDEILRDEFYNSKKRNIPERLTIVTTISQPPYKGFDLVLKTAKILRHNLGLDFVWNCYGNIDSNLMESFTGINHEDVNVQLCGVASSLELREAELSATLYFHSSYIDNSPNSLCEAQMLGLPIVSTNVGGIPSLVTDGQDGFLIPSNDPYQAACCIEQLAKDLQLNIAMGTKAKAKAIARHNPEKIVKQILDVYKSVITC